MITSRILVPIDFSPAQEFAIREAILLAQKSNAGITLLHIIDKSTQSELKKLGKDASHASERLAHLSDEISAGHGISCDYLADEGNVIKDIARVAADGKYNTMVVASHGIRGVRQLMLGADMLKLAKASPIPVVVVKEGDALNLDLNKIVFPVGGQEGFEKNIEATAGIAALFNAEILVYKINRPLEELSAQSKSNLAAARNRFTELGLNFKDVEEEPSVYSLGFAKQIVQYAHSVQAGMIAVMANSSKEYAHFADADKERLISNDNGIAILLTSNENR